MVVMKEVKRLVSIYALLQGRMTITLLLGGAPEWFSPLPSSSQVIAETQQEGTNS